MVACNAAFALYCGATHSQIPRRTDTELLGAETADFVRRIEQAAMQSAERRSADGWVKAPDGRRRYLHAASIPLRSNGGEPMGVLTACRDLSRPHSAREPLGLGAELYRSIFEQAWDSIALVDAATGLMVEFNTAAHENLGYTRDELAGMHVADIDAIAGPNEVAERMQAIWECGGVLLETKYRRKDGTVRDVRVTTRPLMLNGRPYFSAIWSDITERRRNEKLLERQNRVLRTIASVGDLMSEALDEEQLMARFCQTLVSVGQFRMAWVGRIDEDGVSVRPVAGAGFDLSHLDQVDIRCYDSPRVQGPTGTAICLGRTVVDNDTKHSERFASWRELALSLGYGSLAATPLRVRDRIVGAVNLHCIEAEAFGSDEVLLLEKLAAELGAVLERQAAEAALRESEARVRLLLDSTAEAIYGTDTAGVCTFANPACVRMLGYEREEDLLGKSMHVLIHHSHPDGRPYPTEQCRVCVATLAGESTHSDEEVYFRADGSSFPVEYWSHPMYRDDALVGAVVTVVDISERRRTEMALRESEHRYRALFDASGDGIFLMHGDRIVDCNAVALRLFGGSRGQILGSSIYRFSPERQADGRLSREMGREITAAARRGSSQIFEWRYLRQDGSSFDGEVSVTRVKLDSEAYLLGTMRDISERKRTEERMEFLAHHDVLTGLPNRILLRDRFEQAVAAAERARSHVAMLFLDLDNFKLVNDTAGHDAGDQLLQIVVSRLAECVRDTDTVSRQGGDELIVLVNDIPDLEAVERVAGEILVQLAEPVRIVGHVLNTTASVGVSVYPQDGKDFDTLLQKADTAMYSAKDAGRNTYRFFDEEMNRGATSHLRLQKCLQRAMAEGELSLQFQPQLALDSLRVLGAEALLRWHNPGLGEVAPERFVPVAEDSGLIVPIGAWVLREACRQAAQWQHAGLGALTVSVNVSALQLRHAGMVDSIVSALEASGLAPHLLELELAESALLQDLGKAMDTMHSLKALGVRLAIDNFGKGYSSLRHLKRFAVDRLKIDRSFMRALESDPDEASIVQGIVQLGRSLHLEILAQGVETEAQSELLRRAGCQEAQGFLYSQPLAPGALQDFLRRR